MKRENDIIYMKAVPRELPPLPEGKRLVTAAAYSLPAAAPAQPWLSNLQNPVPPPPSASMSATTVRPLSLPVAPAACCAACGRSASGAQTAL